VGGGGGGGGGVWVVVGGGGVQLKKVSGDQDGDDARNDIGGVIKIKMETAEMGDQKAVTEQKRDRSWGWGGN